MSSLYDYVLTSDYELSDVAVVDSIGQVTYRQLLAEADWLAGGLTTLGVKHGDRVVWWTRKSATVVAGLLATMKIGAVAVPIDPLTPSRRADLILADAAASVVVVDEPGPIRTSRTPYTVVSPEELQGFDRTPTLNSATYTDTAYLLYTSGSSRSPS